MSKQTKNSHCDLCGKAIRYINIDGWNVPLEAARAYFIPNANGKDQFYTLVGGLIKGSQVANDGRQGLKVHQCANAK